MKRLAILVLFALSAFAAEKWWDSYNKGVAAVNAGSHDLAVKLLTKSLAEQPTESTSLRAGNTIITYVPHFWLGIAKMNLGDADGALREWKISEEQGAVARTAYYAKMKDWIAKAQREKQRAAHSAVDGPRKNAEGAISRAMQIQGDAMSAGGDRTQSYRDAQRKLQDALTQFRKAGNDANAFAGVAQTAEQAAQLFSAAASEAAARPKPVKPVKPTPAPVVIATETVAPPPPQKPVESAPVISQAKVAAEVAVQEFRRKASRSDGEKLRRMLDVAKTDAEYDAVRLEVEKRVADAGRASVRPEKPADGLKPVVRVDVAPAYRAYASGDLANAERMLTSMLASTPAAEAYLLRGCVRYTRAMLARNADALLASANEDFQAALRRNRDVRLDPKTFSPKLVARFEQVRRGQ